ncbi:MAG TPA: hypothetical protein VIC27_03615, partial [Ktedonobacterales bacterium]
QEGWIGGAWAHALVTPAAGDAPVGVGGYSFLTPLLLHYQAGQWTFVMLAAGPEVGAIHTLAMASAEEGWAAADGGLLHYTGGQWQLTPVSPDA